MFRFARAWSLPSFSAFSHAASHPQIRRRTQQSPEASARPTATPAPTPEIYSAETLQTLNRLRDAALASDYAYRQVAHLANNIGPRLSGSAQAQKAVEYVAGELKQLGFEVQLEKVMVPHWVRGEETAALTRWPGQAENTTQKIVLTALGGSVATPADGLTAEVLVVRDFEELSSLGKEKVQGKIVLFNHVFDRQMAAEDHGGAAYGEAVVYRGTGPVPPPASAQSRPWFAPSAGRLIACRTPARPTTPPTRRRFPPPRSRKKTRV